MTAINYTFIPHKTFSRGGKNFGLTGSAGILPAFPSREARRKAFVIIFNSLINEKPRFHWEAGILPAFPSRKARRKAFVIIFNSLINEKPRFRWERRHLACLSFAHSKKESFCHYFQLTNKRKAAFSLALNAGRQDACVPSEKPRFRWRLTRAGKRLAFPVKSRVFAGA
jgi:hypothetical protein